MEETDKKKEIQLVDNFVDNRNKTKLYQLFNYIIGTYFIFIYVFSLLSIMLNF